MVLLGGATLPLSGQQAKMPPVPVPNVSGPIPVTADSHPFNASALAQVVIDLPKAGYVEEEFVISGKANVYSWAADNTIKIKTPDAPYATRILPSYWMNMAMHITYTWQRKRIRYVHFPLTSIPK
jgi:hypothetical protein